MVAISNIVLRGNDAIKVNPPPSNIDIHLTSHGSDWLWAVFSIFALLTFVHTGVFVFTSRATNSIKKFVAAIPIFTNIILAVSYFTYAANLGYTSTSTEFRHVTTDEDLGERQVFYVRYIGWFCAYPFVLFAIEIATNSIELQYDTKEELISKIFNLLSGLVSKILSIEIFSLGYLIGILILSTYKWGYYVFGTVGLIANMSLVIHSFLNALKSSENKRVGSILVLFQLVLWVLYPIAWGVSEGGNKIQPDSEAVFYGILDLFTFGIIPSALTFVNMQGLSDEIFSKFGHSHEKTPTESHRISGETAADTTVADV